MSKEDSLEEAVDAVRELNGSVNGLAVVVAEDRTSSQRRDKWLAVSVILDVILSLALMIAGYFIDSNQNEISSIQHSQQELTELNRTNQCAMVKMFLSYSSTTQRSTTLSEEEKQQRLQGYAVIQKIHDDLKCVD
jgi:hypothetical protein